MNRAIYIAKRGGIIAICVYFGFVGLTMFSQDALIFFPEKLAKEKAHQIGKAFGMTPWHAPSGDFIGWRRPTTAPRPVLLVFHGNAGMALHRMDYFRGFDQQPIQWDVRLVEYPGYGPRSGKPSEKEFFAAAEQALAVIHQEQPGVSVYLLGESIGSGPACYLAGRHPKQIAGLFLVTPFTSLVDVAALHQPWMPVQLLLRHRFENTTELSNYRGPLAVLCAENDEIVIDLGQQLFDNYLGPKRLWLDEESGHNTLELSSDRSFWREVAQFLQNNALHLNNSNRPMSVP